MRTSRTASLTGSPPSASRAARRAASSGMPCATNRSRSVSSAARSSSSSSRSTALLRKMLRHALASRARSGIALIRFENQPDGEDDAGPVLLLGGQLPLPRRGDPVVLGAAAFGGFSPLPSGVALLLQPVQRG